MRTQIVCALVLFGLAVSQGLRPKFETLPSFVPNPNTPLITHDYTDGTTALHYEIVHSAVFLLDTENHIQSVSCQGTTMKIETTANYQLQLPVNTTLTGSAQWKCKDETGRTDTPLYRRVLSVSAPAKSGNNYIYTVQTAFAGVADCFEDGSLMTVTSTAMATRFTGNQSWTVTKNFGWNYDAGSGHAAKDYSLWSSGKSHLDCSNCFVDFQFGATLSVAFGRKGLLPYLADVKTNVYGTAKLNTEVTAATSGSVKSSGSKVVETVTLPGFEFYVGFVPIKIEFSIPITVGYSFAGEAAASYVTGFDLDADVKLGLEYNGQWTPSASDQFNANFHKPVLTKAADAEATAYIGAVVNVDLYAIAGVQFNIQRTLNSNATYPGSCSNTQVHFDADTSLLGTVDAQLIKPVHKQSPSITLIKSDKQLADQCY